MESTGARAEGGRKLVLGFDAGCMACSELAKRIEERVGGKLEVRSLHHPQVEHWRGQALGEDAPWAPTLFEVGGAREVRAWTGSRMAVRLARALGPVSTWRVMQALGEVSVPKVAVSGGPPAVVAGGGGLSRGQFLKGMGGAALAFGVLSGTSSPALAADAGLPREQLIEAFSAIEEIPASVIKRGDQAVRNWLGRRLQVVAGGQQRGVWACAKAIGFALVSNAIPVAKILKIRAAIRAVGGARNFANILQLAYATGIKRGYTRWGAMKYAAKRAADVSGVDVVNALLGLFSLDGVVSNCF